MPPLVQSTGGLAKIHATFDDPNLVSRAGLVPVMALARKARLRELADERLTVPTDKGANPGLKLSSVVAGSPLSPARWACWHCSAPYSSRCRCSASREHCARRGSRARSGTTEPVRPHPALVDLAAGRLLGPTGDPAVLVRSAREHRMGGLLWTRVGQGELELDAPARRTLVEDDLVFAARRRRLWSALASVAEQVQSLGIEVATVKGVTAEARWTSTPLNPNSF